MRLLLPFFISLVLLGCSSSGNEKISDVDTSLTDNQPPKPIEKKVEKLFSKYFYFSAIDMNDEFENSPTIQLLIDIKVLEKDKISPFKRDSVLTNNEFIINGKYGLKVSKIELSPQIYEIMKKGLREEREKDGSNYFNWDYFITKLKLNDFADKEGTRFDIYTTKLMKIELKCDQAEIVQEFE